MKKALSLDDLVLQIKSIKEKYPQLRDDDLFVLWFIKAYLTDNDSDAQDSIVGGSGDKSLDAVLIDHKAKAVSIVQGKYRQFQGKKSENRNDILELAQLAITLGENDDYFRTFLHKMEALSAKKILEARKYVSERKYRLNLFYITMGNISDNHIKEAKKRVRSSSCDEVSIDFLNFRRILLLLSDYIDGVAPPIPTLDLEIEHQSRIQLKSVFQRNDDSNNLETWAFTMRGDAIADLYEYAGARLFARNIRGFLGEDKGPNKAILNTIDRNPDFFFYFNNGITIVCDFAEKKDRNGKEVLKVSNPQIINGQQTTRMLSMNKSHSKNVSVLVKVIQISGRGNRDKSDFDKLISNIVVGTNWQSTINQADLRSNDSIQIDIDREFRKLGYYYIRKRQTKNETKRQVGCKYKIIIKKEELGQAVAACELDPVIARQGVNAIFGDKYYNNIFLNNKPYYYLPRYWLTNAVTYCSKGYSNRSYAKWLVVNFVWNYLSSIISKEYKIKTFCKLYEKEDHKVWLELKFIINRVFSSAFKFYQLKKGHGEQEIDISQFYKNNTRLHLAFNKYWNKKNPQDRTKCNQARKRLDNLLKQQ